MPAPSALQQQLVLKRVAGCDIFTSAGRPQTGGHLFGGQVLAQSLVAAARTVPAGFEVHSLHGYFILAGEGGVEILFDVDRVRDGKSFMTRAVKALQRNRAIFQLTASFHRAEWGPVFQTPAAELRAIVESRGLEFDNLSPPQELAADLAPGSVAPATGSRGSVAAKQSTEQVLVAEGEYWTLKWYRHRSPIPDRLDGPDWPAHSAVLAYCSDMGILGHIRRPHARTHSFRKTTSLDHTIHFHRPFRFDDWLLFHTRTSVSAGARGIARTEVFTAKGTLVATVDQEGLIRPTRPQGSAGKPLRSAL